MVMVGSGGLIGLLECCAASDAKGRDRLAALSLGRGPTALTVAIV